MATSFVDTLFPGEDGGAAVVPWFRAVEADDELAGFVMLAERTDATPGGVPLALSSTTSTSGTTSATGCSPGSSIGCGPRATGRCSSTGPQAAGSPGPFYLARGFVPTGVVDDGEIEARLTL